MAHNLMWEVIHITGNFSVVRCKFMFKYVQRSMGPHEIISNLVLRTLMVSWGSAIYAGI